MTTTQFYSIACKTHLHVGSGDSNYGVIDNLVQRDPSNNLPCIFASSLKGAFREYFKEIHGLPKTEDIFGKTDKSKIIFHQGFILSIPVRSNQYPYFNLTAPVAIQELIEQLEMMNKGKYKALIEKLTAFKNLAQADKAVVFNIPTTNLQIEDYEGTTIAANNTNLDKSLTDLFGERIVLVDDKMFLEMCGDYRLPVIARNNLENGQSKNLWYEQIIPRGSKFFFAATTVPNEPCADFFNEFSNPKHVQIGANATIGYGVTQISTF